MWEDRKESRSVWGWGGNGRILGLGGLAKVGRVMIKFKLCFMDGSEVWFEIRKELMKSTEQHLLKLGIGSE